MPLAGFTVNGQQYSVAEAIRLAEAGEIGYPASLVRAADSDRVDSSPSASTLSGCFRQFELKRTTPYYPRIEDKLAPLFGTAMHSLLEAKDEESPLARPLGPVFTEQAIQGTVTLDSGAILEIRGRVDYVNTATGVVRDYKTKRYVPKGFEATAGHKAQVNVYGWMWGQSRSMGVPVKTWEIVYFDQSSVVVQRGELAPLAETEAWIKRRLGIWHKHFTAGTLPPPVLAFFGKDKKERGLCEYCEVRRQCQAAWEEGR